MVFKAKKDLFYTIVFSLIFIFLSLSIYDTVSKKEWLASFMLALLFGFLAYLWFGTKYVILDGKLIIRSGPFKQELLIKDITSIRYTKNPFTSAALALERIELNDRHYNTIQISPKHLKHFIEVLFKLNPNIKRMD